MVGSDLEQCRPWAVECIDVIYAAAPSNPCISFRNDYRYDTDLYMEGSCYSNRLLFVGERFYRE